MQQLTALRILFIDAYDSFSNNVISLLETSLDAEVTVIKIDTPIRDFLAYVQQFSAVVAGPGPGDPRNVADVGHFQQLWELPDNRLLPVLGICLGFQSLVLAHGGAIHQLPEPRHGLVRTVQSDEQSIFRGLSQFETVQYHSLHGTLGSRVSEERGPTYHPSRSVPNLIPLAWSSTIDSPSQARNGKDENPSHILMGVRHILKPFFGVQFHPESICSTSAARKVVHNWGQDILAWNHLYRKPLDLYHDQLLSTDAAYEFPSPSGSESDTSESESSSDGGSLSSHNTEKEVPRRRSRTERFSATKIENSDLHQDIQVQWTTLAIGSLRVPDICHLLNLTEGQSVIFDSERRPTQEVGQFSIIGILEPRSLRFEYSVGDSSILQLENNTVSKVSLDKFNGDPFEYFEHFMHSHKAENGQQDIPFWGGLAGYITYEACLQCLERTTRTPQGSLSATSEDAPKHPSLGFAYIERSIVIDHFRDAVVVQSIRPDDLSWLESTSSLLSSPSPSKADLHLLRAQLPPFTSKITLPTETRYKSRIRECKESICAGDSYELCLTDKAFVEVSERLPPWSLYLRLRELNPAPFGAYLRLGKLSFLSSSPERFMRWTRPVASKSSSSNDALNIYSAESTLQFRPIKGTVSRIDKATSRCLSLREAEEILSTPKEQAENLMIVDLIRHDLHGVVGSGRVSVPKLMTVEEYETVFQLVSVIEGNMRIRASPSSSPKARVGSSPLTALPATLPPGSMTGAPKLRSCQILRGLECKERGAYSGVVGYMDVGGGGDWSVAIRCAVQWDSHGSQVSEPMQSPRKDFNSTASSTASQDHALVNNEEYKQSGGTWTIGAGGAVTALSTEEGEWHEMLAKLHATLRLFE